MKRMLVLGSLITATLAFATPPASESPEKAAARSVVEETLIKPLRAKELKRSHFSRARLPPQARRVRILDAEPQKDPEGAAFVTFAVDARHGYLAEDDPNVPESDWRKDTLTGCVYVERGEVFVKLGDEHQPAAILLGQRTMTSTAHACQPAAAQLAQANPPPAKG
jgi:hypothetical protein